MILFGDPSLELRTKAPLALTTTHKQTDNVGISNLVVDCNVEGAYIALTVGNKIIGTGYVTGGKVDIKFTNPITTDAVINVTGTAFNYSPYFGQVIIGNATNVETIDNVSSFDVYPNPSESSVTVSFGIQQRSNYTLELKNMLGQIVFSESLPSDFVGQYNKQIDIASYGKGVYTLSLNGTHNRINKKVIVK
jgi:hypothetical protein